MKALSLLVLSCLLMAAPALGEPVRTVLWWRQHAVERTALLSKCRNDPGRLMLNPDCVNASKAEYAAEMSRKHGFYNMPIDLGPTPWRMDNPDNPLPSTRKR